MSDKKQKLELTEEELAQKIAEAKEQGAQEVTEAFADDIEKAREEGIEEGIKVGSKNTNSESNHKPKKSAKRSDIPNGGVNLRDRVEATLKVDAYGKSKGSKYLTHPSNVPHLIASGLIEKEVKKIDAPKLNGINKIKPKS